MRTEIDAVAFDIDGTMYSNWAFWLRLLPFLVRNARFLAEFGRVRAEIRAWQDSHPGVPHPDFFEWQAALLAAKIGETPERSLSLIDEKIYRGWRPLFARVRPYAGLRECLESLRASGLKIGILSDFLPSQKGDIWGLAALSDATLGSEETGALKPSPIPFRALSAALGVPSARILYVGNSVRSDVAGAASAGMKSALIAGPLSSSRASKPRPDISFSSYRQLTRIVLN